MTHHTYSHGFPEFMPQGSCDSFSSQDSCDSNGCSWCKSAAVKSACYTKEDAAKLPASIFACDGISEEQERDTGLIEEPYEQLDAFLFPPQASCNDYTNQETCDPAGCSWCVSAAVKSACYTKDDARKLPDAVFRCDNLSEVKKEPVKTMPESKKIMNILKGDTCSGVSSQDSCDNTSGCTWCKSAAVKSACYSEEDAAKLPPSIFACDGISEEKTVPEPKPTPAPRVFGSNHYFRNFMKKDASCTGVASQDTCDNTSGCTWCKSAAVKSACYSEEDAAKLPPSIFACDNAEEESDIKEEVVSESQKFLDAIFGDDSCTGVASQDSCDKISGCTWCVSAAVKSACYSKEDAAKLPPSIFGCDNLAEEEPEAHGISFHHEGRHHGKHGHHDKHNGHHDKHHQYKSGYEGHHGRSHCHVLAFICAIIVFKHYYNLFKMRCALSKT